MKILFVAANLPIPNNNGQAIRSLSIIRALAEGGHKVGFVSFAPKDRPKDLAPLSHFCDSIDLVERETPNLTTGTEYVRRARCLLTYRSFSFERFRSETMRQTIQNRLLPGEYDLAICDQVYGMVNIPPTKTPVLINCHNVEYVIPARYSEIEKHPIKKTYAKLESHLIRRAERQSCGRAAAAMVCSQLDFSLLRQLQPRLAIFVVPNVIDTDAILPLQAPSPGNSEPILLFLGGMDWYPNRDAVEYFVHSILPRVREEYPTVKFMIAGRNAPSSLTDKFRPDPRIVFTGTVADVRPYLSSATIVVVPLRMGGGTRIKILEACAAGKPVVSTSVGAEGLDLKRGIEIVLADEPQDFARSIIHMLRDPFCADSVAQASRAAVVERYSRSVLATTLEACLSSLQ